MSITDQQFEAIILRLEGGESIASIQADYPHLEEDIAALEDLQDFFAAQRSTAKPNPQGLKSVLRQVDLLSQASNDDERTWGSFFTPWMRYASVAVPALMVLAVGGYMWQPTVSTTAVEPVEIAMVETDVVPIAFSDRMISSPAPRMMAMESEVAEPNSADMDMNALVESLSNEFASDMAEFETTRERLEPLFSEQLFSYHNTTTL